MSGYRIGIVGGDGVGPEVVAEARKALDAAARRFGLSLDYTDYDIGGERYLRTGEVLPSSVQDELAGQDAILLGAVGMPGVPPGVLERGLLLKLRFDLDLYVNLRPVKLYPGVASPIAGLTPDRCDMVVVRENTEGLYVGAGGVVRRGTPWEVATQESLNTRFGVERLLRDAYGRAQARSGHLTLVHKTNVLNYAGDLWMRAATEVGAEFPDVALDYQHVDAMCLFLVTAPERFDVVATDNLFGDIITDLGAAVQGGMGLAASGNLNPVDDVPGLFEPVHGSAPDIAGTGRANPAAAVLSAALLLDHLGEADAARAVEAAVAGVLPIADGKPTRQVGDLIAEAVSSG